MNPRALFSVLFSSVLFSSLVACVAQVDDEGEDDADAEPQTAEVKQAGLIWDYGWFTISATSPGTGLETWGTLQNPVLYRLYTSRTNGVEQAFPYVQRSSYTPNATWRLFAYYWANCADGSQPVLYAAYEGRDPYLYPRAVSCPRYVRMDSAVVMLNISAM